MDKKSIKLALLAPGCLILVSLVACSSGAINGQMETANVTRGDIVRHVTADGRLAFVDYRNLTFGTIGKITQIGVSELDRVSKGQVLARLDTTPLEQVVRAAELGIKAVELAQKSVQMDRTLAENGVKSAEASLKQVQNSVKSAGIDLDAATDNFRKITYPYTYSTFTFDVPQALGYMADAGHQITEAVAGLQPGLTADQYAQALTQLQQALDNLTRGQELLSRGQGQDVFSSGLLTVKDFWTLRAAQQAMDKAQLGLENAKTVAGNAAVAVDSARTAFNKAQLAIDKSNNDMELARNSLDMAKTNLANAVIVAPFDGIIADVNVKVGDILSQLNYTSTAIEIIDPSRLELDIKVNEIDIPNVKLGQKVAISVDALPDKWFEGVVTSISPLPLTASSTVSYEVKTVLNVPPDSALKAGMGATVDITINRSSHVLLVPSRAVKKDSQGKTVVEVLVNGQTQARPVVIGMSDGRQTEIVDGLDEEQTIVVGQKAFNLYDGPQSKSSLK